MAVGPSMPGLRAVVASGPVACREALVGIRAGLYRFFRKRADALFDRDDAVLTTHGVAG